MYRGAVVVPELAFVRGVWRGPCARPDVWIVVAGGEDAPSAPHLAAARDLVARWDEVERAIRGYLRALLPDGRVPVQRRTNEAFAARDCGFEGELCYQALSVSDPDLPARAILAFYTGEPDGYATYELVLDGGVPTSIRCYAS